MDQQNLVRLQNEFKIVEDASQDGTLQNVFVELAIKNNAKDFMNWNFIIYGRENSIWEGGEFKGTLKFSAYYPDTHPTYYWQGLGKKKFYHMNVWENGETCIDILSFAYSPTTTILEIVMGLENLLYDPNPESPIDDDQAKLFMENRNEYDEKVKQFVKEYMQQQG